MLQRTKPPLESPALAVEPTLDLTEAQRQRLHEAIFGQRLENTLERETVSLT